MADSILTALSASLPDEVTFNFTQFQTGNANFGKDSYFDVEVTGDSSLAGLYDGFCIDTDRGIEPSGTFTAKVFSTYEELPEELLGDQSTLPGAPTGFGNIEKPENFDLVNWILNQCFVGKELFDDGGNSLGVVTYGDVQRAIWALIDDENSTTDLGPFSQGRADLIQSLAEANGENFVPSFEYTTIFGEQVTGQAGVILVPDSDGFENDENDVNPFDRQFIIIGVELAKLGDFVFEDSNADGTQDDGEQGIDGVEVKLLADLDGDGNFTDVVDTTTTGDNPNTADVVEAGYYEFTVLPGDYQVMFTQPEGFDGVSPFQVNGGPTENGEPLDSDADPNDGLMSDVVTLESGEFDPTIDAGFFKTAGLGDFVFDDTNRDGIQDADEQGIDGVEVKLLADTDGDGAIDDVVATTFTGDNLNTTDVVEAGYYEFTGLTPGIEYKVMFTQPEGFDGVSPFQVNGGPTDNGEPLDSDADPNNGLMSDVVVLESGEFDPTIDAGFFKLIAGINIEKFVNGFNADTVAEAVEIAAGDDVTFTYEVTNIGEVAFAASEVVVTDDNGTAGDTSDDFNPVFVGGDLNNNGFLDVGETWSYSQTEAAQDLSTVIDFEGFAAGTVIDDEYLALGITISATGGSGQAMIFDSANPTGGDGDLATDDQGNILIISEDGDSSDPDDNAGSGTFTFDFENGVDVDSINFVDIEEGGGTISTFDADGNLIDSQAVPITGDGGQATVDVSDEDVSRLEVFLAGSGAISGLELGSGIYKNVGTVVAGDVSDEDHGFYKNPEVDPIPGINIEKFVNGANADTPVEAVEIAAGDEVTFTYVVKNIGEVAFAASDVVVTDDNGTAGDAGDDFNPTFVGGDVNNNGFLDTDETWIYTKSEAAQDLTTVTSSQDVRFHLTGSSSLDGSNGNVRTFTEDGVSVEVSAFSSNKHGSDFKTAYLGAYGGGLGVTNRHESTSGHRVDNSGSIDYILFEFDQDVTVDRAFLDYVRNDSDISVWIGDRDGAITDLDSALLGSFVKENNFGGRHDRWADFNSDELSGNTLIISAWTDGHDDAFKLKKLDVSVAGEITIGNYQNVATVTAQDASDSDTGNYTNPSEPPFDPKHVLIEAEDMHLCYYTVEHVGDDVASGGEVIKLTGHDGYASTHFTGHTGYYQVDVAYYDENDGHAMGKVKIGGETIDTWTFDQHLNSAFASAENRIVRTVSESVFIEQGEQIKLSGWFDHSEFARFDAIKFTEVEAPQVFHYEAEDLHLSGYKVEHVGEHIASGGEVIKLTGHKGSASLSFNGSTGEYDVIVGYYDENDGHAQGQLLVGGEVEDHWTFSQHLGSNVASSSNFVERTIEDVFIEAGEQIKFKGFEDAHEFARIDYIKVVGSSNSGSNDGSNTPALTDTDLFTYVNAHAPNLIANDVLTDALI